MLATAVLFLAFSAAVAPQPIERSFDLASLFEAEPFIAEGGMNFFSDEIGSRRFISFPVSGFERGLWSTDGIRTQALAQGRVGGFAAGFLYVGATAQRIFLWSEGHLITSDGTEAGTSTQPVDWRPANFERMESLGDIGFFRVRFTGDDGLSLVASDGTPEGTKRLPLAHGNAPADVGKLVVVDGIAYFAAPRAVDGARALRGVWSTDGTAAGTQLLIDPVGTSKDWSVYRVGGQLLLREETPTLLRIHRWIPDQGLQTLLEASRAESDRIVYQFPGRFVFPAGSNRGDQLWVSDGTVGGTRRLTDFQTSPFGAGFGFNLIPLEAGLLIAFPQGPNYGIHSAGWDGGFRLLTADCRSTCGTRLSILGNGRELVFEDGDTLRRNDGLSATAIALDGVEPWKMYGHRLLFTRVGPVNPPTLGIFDLETHREISLDLDGDGFLHSVGPALADGTPLVAVQVGRGYRVLRIEDDGATSVLLESATENQDAFGLVGTAGSRFVALASSFFGEPRLVIENPQGPPSVFSTAAHALRDLPDRVVLTGSFQPSQSVRSNGQIETLSPHADLDFYVGSSTTASFFIGSRIDDFSRHLFALPVGSTQLVALGQNVSRPHALATLVVFDCEQGLCRSTGGAPAPVQPTSLTQDRILSSVDNGSTAFFLMDAPTPRVIRVDGTAPTPLALTVPLPAALGQPISVGPATLETLVISTIPDGGGFARHEIALDGSQSWVLASDGEIQVLLVADPYTFYRGTDGFLRITDTSFTEGRLVTTPDGAYLTDATELHPFGNRVLFQAFHPEVGRELWSVGLQESEARLERDLYPGPASSAPLSLASTAERLYFVAQDGRSSAQIFSIDRDADDSCGAREFTVCLGQRFEVEVDWSTKFGTFGRGVPAQLTQDTGYFWFFDEDNAEVFVKMLDGRAITDHFWTFFGGLSDTAFQVDVFDTESGRTRRYGNPQGRFASFGDVESTSGELLRAPGIDPLEQVVGPGSSIDQHPAGLVSQRLALDTAPCNGQTALCLGQGARFEVTLEWTEFGGNSGSGRPEALTQDTGYFWFFDADIAEVVVKILDGTSINGEFWVFSGSLSNVAYDMTVRDTHTGLSKRYRNELGVFRSFGDVSGFSAPASSAPR